MKTKQFWQSANFWTALVLAIGAGWSGFLEEEASEAVRQLFLFISSASAVREYLKTGPKFDFRKALGSKNFWNYLGSIGVIILPTLPGELFVHLQTLAENLLGGNWQGALVAAFSIVTILYHIFRKTPEPNLA